MHDYIAVQGSMTLFILAAGMGSRYGGLKQIDSFTEDGEFIIDFSIYDAIKAGFDRVVFLIKEENYEVFRDTVGSRIEGKVKVEYAFQKLDSYMEKDLIPADRVKPWGTTQALLCGRELLNEPFAVINADDFYGRDAFMKVADFLRNATENKYCMIGYHVGNTLTDNGSVARGVCEIENGHLAKIVERTKIYKTEDGARFFEDDGTQVDIAPSTVVSMNFWGFTPSVFAGLERDFEEFKKDIEKNPLKCEALLPNSIGKMITDGECEVSVLETTAKWFGVTYADDKPNTIARIKELIDCGEYPRGLWK